MITIATWNINSIKVRLNHVLTWLEQNRPDFLFLQEIKCVNDAFPTQSFLDAGYQSHINGQTGYNGVAILTKHPTELISDALLIDDPQARYLEIKYQDMHLINLYAPNGNTPDTHPLGTEKFNYKLTWLDALYQRTKELRTQRIPFLLGGDFNIIPKPIDARHPEQWINDALYQPQSHAAWQSLINTGMIDAYRALYPKQEHAYTFWDYQAGAWPRDNGIRIDHFLLSPPLADRLDKIWIDKAPRAAEKPSDHTVLALSLS